MNKHTCAKGALLAVLLLAVAGCGEDESGGGVGTYTIAIYGEEFIEEEIPADEVVDGWAITFTRFLIAVDAIGATDGAVSVGGAYVFDLTEGSGGEGHTVAALEVPSGDYTSLTYRVGPAVASAEAAAGASADDVTMMVDMGYSIYIEGVATKGGDMKTFAWGFTTDTTYTNCETAAKIDDGGVGSSRLTIHGDHFFFDDLVSEEPQVAFDLIASGDADGDGAVTAAELAAVDITTQTRYQVGSATISDMWGFLEAQSEKVGHIDGEGHCDTE